MAGVPVGAPEVRTEDSLVQPREDGAYVFHHPPKFQWSGEGPVPAQSWNRYSVYVHVPFCRKICTFCTFERKRLRRSSMATFTDQLWRELETAARLDNFSQAAVHSVYIGGGTGSLLPNQDIARLVTDLRSRFGLVDAEVTLECEPGTKNQEDFEFIRTAGVNRISIGIQAFQDALLKRLNRSHTAAQAVDAVTAAKKAGFENIHVDLMYGLPGQDIEMWRASLERAIELDIPHISTYQLIVFQDELLDRQIRTGESPDRAAPAEVNRMRQECRDWLAAQGFEQYSLTEFARPGYRCDYVTTTWDGSDYLGFGPAAYSRRGPQLWENDLIHAAYGRKVDSGQRPVGRSIRMTPQDQLRRDVAMGLCLLTIDVAELETRADARVDDCLAHERDSLVAEGLLQIDGNSWSLTESGIRYATEVMKRFTV